jgi:O-antigen/teichoic acid export membrane protein
MAAAFADATELLLILLPGVYLMGLESVLVQHFNALGLYRVRFRSTGSCTLILNLVLYSRSCRALARRALRIAFVISYAAIFALVALSLSHQHRPIFHRGVCAGSLRG